MKIEPTSLAGALVLQPRIFGDERGFFFESYNHQSFKEATGLDLTFVQDNHSKSVHGVLRGIHFQTNPAAQGKLVRVTSGEIFDVAVDLRKDSPTFGKWEGVVLSAENYRQFWVPAGFGHGFLVLSETAEVQYKVDQYWSREHEHSLRWDDPDINIQWPDTKTKILSDKDRNASNLKELAANGHLA